MRRRQFLQALGLSALATTLRSGPSARVAMADGTSPRRIVFYVQPHGNIPNAWNMPIPGGPTDAYAERPLHDLAPADMSPTLRAFHPFRDRILAIEGLSHTAALADIAAVMRAGSGDLNNHQIGVADVLTGTRALQRTGTYCSGGARSIDQELAVRLAAPGRFDSRVYGVDYIPNSMVSPFSYLGPGQATPMVSDPSAAFADLLGYVLPSGTPKTRDELLKSLRPSVLDAARTEYDLLAPRLDADGRRKLEQHRDLIRELELSLGKSAGGASCGDTAFDSSGVPMRQFMRLIRLAFACDLTRIVTVCPPVPQCPELGYPAVATFHVYGHQSINGHTSCGQTYSPLAEQAMTDLDAWHAGHVAYLLAQLDSVPEGSGTMLDHTLVVWMAELATPTHQHHDVSTLIAGGGSTFKMGRYMRYPRTLPNPLPNEPLTGPAHNRLLVSLMQAMGQTDQTFGLTDVTADNGTPISLRGGLPELHG
jgi:hypothetical protein